jgi:putative Mg2+ transporter-C (MgtC) family protein
MLGRTRNFSGTVRGEMSPYFTELTCAKATLYLAAIVYVVSASIVAAVEPFLTIPCTNSIGHTFANPAYDASPCREQRYMMLLGLTPLECAFGRRLVAAVLLGGIIGWERRQADRPAGIRTMSLVSLGSCLFTITSSFAFLNGPMGWDASRVSAAIPSGVGFLGAGLIFKKDQKTSTGDHNHVVTGLTTAASVWLSAAVGIACGGDLYFAASFGTAIMMLLLRFGPRGQDDDHKDDDDEEFHQYLEKERASYASLRAAEGDDSAERRSLRSSNILRSTRLRPALASNV